MVLHSWGHTIKYCIGTKRKFVCVYWKEREERERERDSSKIKENDVSNEQLSIDTHFLYTIIPYLIAYYDEAK